MGWWGFGVMDGDAPLDSLYDFEDVFEGEWKVDREEVSGDDLFNTYPYFCGFFFTKNKIIKNIPRFNKRSINEIDLQVVGVILIYYGIKIPVRLKKDILEAIDKDEWSTRESKRKAMMDKYYTFLEKYNGDRGYYLDDKSGEFICHTPNAKRFIMED